MTGAAMLGRGCWGRTAAVVLVLLGVGACDDGGGGGSGGPTAASGSASEAFVPPQPLSREEFHAIVVTANGFAEIDPAVADNVFDGICSGSLSTFIDAMFAYPSQAAAYERIFDDVERQCGVPPATLDRARGDVAWSMSSNQLALERLTGAGAVTGFCGTLQRTSDLTSTLIGEAAEAAGLAPDGGSNLVELGVAVLIQACPDLLSQVSG